MKLIHYKDEEGRAYPSDLAKGAIGRVVIGKADGDTSFCMRVFEIEPGGHSAKHIHEYEHQVFVHSGQGEIWNGEGWQDVTAGSIIYIPGGEEHQLRNNGQELLTFVCCIPEGAPEL
jgi:quercetin dioxygenase-like cupin family protein